MLSAIGDYKEGVCKDGADYLCGPRNGVYSCRPCDYAQLAVFQDLQRQLNRIVSARKMASKEKIDDDGRIGEKTARTMAAVTQAMAGVAAPTATVQAVIQAAAQNPGGQSTIGMIAQNAVEVRNYVKQTADVIGAPPAQASSSSGVVVDTSTNPPTLAPKKSHVKAVVGTLAAMTAIGLIGAGVYYRRA